LTDRGGTPPDSSRNSPPESLARFKPAQWQVFPLVQIPFFPIIHPPPLSFFQLSFLDMVTTTKIGCPSLSTQQAGTSSFFPLSRNSLQHQGFPPCQAVIAAAVSKPTCALFNFGNTFALILSALFSYGFRDLAFLLGNPLMRQIC